ncbi:Smg8/Smg9 [Corchorus olitorius]|uniref:Nonsense-mediated mRNA decay factor SMG8 n=1 Tax=Corchorus olitorius TaxID=93759 RepID=A0A1R3J6G0_9ROSI|nr:Smg8/Smg9 [Corchorus olitorius]
MDTPNPPSMRVLTRPPPSPIPTSSSDPTPALPPSSPSLPRSPDGVVVVGFISRRPDNSSQLINRIIDSNVFGSGQLDRVLSLDKDELKDWFKYRRISYYHEEDKGILFLQFSSKGCPVFDGSLDFDEVLEEREFGDLQGLLFMFSVCHIIIYIQEGSRFDTENLKKFRVLQAAKHSLTPYVKSRTTPPMPSRPHSSSSSRPSTIATAVSTSPVRSGGMLGRNASAISLMSGLGSYTSLFPGQCTPVALFVFIDDFSDVPNSTSNIEESETSSLNHASSSSSLARPASSMKGSASVVVLARPVSKSEGGFRKKLHSSLEAQIRFLIKKCRTLSGTEGSHSGSRGGGVSNSAPLFSLDASRAVVLLDKATNQSGEPLEFATGLVEDVLNGKATSDSFLLETHSQRANKDDLSSLKDFIYRQSDILRGRGGLVSNTNSGPAAGVGMVAVAAAAAAASAASGKTSTTTPELPGLDVWLSSSLLFLHGLLSAKRGCIDETEMGKRKPRRNIITGQTEGVASRSSESLDMAASWLESGKGLNRKFSSLWCERALPAAKDIYLKDLPACYPTSLHEVHLEKALHSFHSMVRGPAVQLFTKKLEEECTSIWKSGRQLCDAVSLTGKPCMHQRHDVETGEFPSGTSVKPHSSGYVFLHACACGRTRRLRSDPFDFESANITSNCFPDCDKLLSRLQLPEVSSKGPIQPSSWSLIRIGGGRYYEPSKGLLQSGFCTTEKFLLKWTIYLEKQKAPNSLTAGTLQLGSMGRSSADPKAEFSADVQLKKASATEFGSGGIETAVENPRKPLEISKFNGNKISFGRGLPNFTMKKPFSEVVAGSATTDSGFPPLQQRKQPSSGSERGMKKNKASDQSLEGVHETVDQGSQKPLQVSSVQQSLNRVSSDGSTDTDPFLRIGSNVVPMNVSNDEKAKLNPDIKHVTAYVGFEHECPHGHRFLLNPEHLNQLGAPYSLFEESQNSCPVESSDPALADSSKVGKNVGHSKVHRNTNGIIAAAAPVSKMKSKGTAKQLVANGNVSKDGLTQLSMPEKDHNQTFVTVAGLPVTVKDLETGFHSVSLDDGGSSFSMLNRDLPIYMNCPHCRSARDKKVQPKVKFASSISQLQRIFLVTPPFPVVLAANPVIQFERLDLAKMEIYTNDDFAEAELLTSSILLG